MEPGRYRLVTRSDFDGLVCAALLKELGMIDDILFVHPKDMQDGLVPIGPRDITTNLPYVPGAAMAFDHHFSETIRVGRQSNHIINPDAPSAARVVYEHFGGAPAFPRIAPALMTAVDKGDSAQFSMTDVLNPEGWDLLNFLMDARTGLGRFRDFRLSNYQLMLALIDQCRSQSIEDILASPDVSERVDLYRQHQPLFKSQLERCTRVIEKLAIIDLRDQNTIYAGNRFMIYALFPHTNVSMHVLWGKDRQNTVLAIGKSIFDRSAKVNVGELCLAQGGGGHEAAGTCQIPNDGADQRIAEVASLITAAG